MFECCVYFLNFIEINKLKIRKKSKKWRLKTIVLAPPNIGRCVQFLGSVCNVWVEFTPSYFMPHHLM